MSPLPGAFACVLLLFAVVAALICTVDAVRARRADRQLEDERRMRRGWKAAQRFGLLPEDLQ